MDRRPFHPPSRRCAASALSADALRNERNRVVVRIVALLAMLAMLAWTGAARAEEPLERPAALFLEHDRDPGSGHATAFVVQGDDRVVWFEAGAVTYCRTEQNRTHTVRMAPVGASSHARPRGTDAVADVHRFRGGGATHGRAYRGVVYENLWPGVDLVYRTESGVLKYDVVVHPGADPEAVRFAYSGADDVVVDSSGALRIATSLGDLVDEAPVAYERGVGGAEVSASFLIEPPVEGVSIVGFALGAYDSSRTLVIDPALSLYCGYLGGMSADGVADGTVDAAGNAYVAGHTTSVDFPVAVGPGLVSGGLSDAFVGKLDPQGNVTWLGFIGGSGNDDARGVDVDGAGNVYVVGRTRSTEASFPVTGGPDLTFNGGLGDAWIAKVQADGSRLVYCGYLGGADLDVAIDVAVDATGAAYIGGNTKSRAQTFPVVTGPWLVYRGEQDAFVAKVDPTGSALTYCGYLGANGEDDCAGVDVDASGRLYLTGFTTLNSSQFPVVVGPDLTFNGHFQDSDAYVARVAADGTAFEYCGYIGGDGPDRGRGLVVDEANRAWVVGLTTSTGFTFPVAVGPSMTHAGGDDGFVAVVAADGTALERCGYIGGSADDEATEIAIDPFGRAWIAGETRSTDPPSRASVFSQSMAVGVAFPLRHGPESTNDGGGDAFVARVTLAGDAIEMAGFFGGAGFDRPRALGIGGDESVVLFGETSSNEETFPVNAAPSSAFAGATDGFVAKFRLEPPCVEGTVNRGGSALSADVLFVNGSAGRPWREVESPTQSTIEISMMPAPAGPLPGPFVLYARLGEPSYAGVAPLPRGIGDLCFGIALTGGQPDYVWNNIGRYPKLGIPNGPSSPAPSMPLFLPGGLPSALTVTFQGILLDDASAGPVGASVTNAVVLRVQ